MKLPPRRLPKHKELQNRDVTGQNSWFLKCKADGVPCVSVLVRRTLVDVEWDCLTLPQEVERAVCDDPALKLILTGIVDAVMQKNSFSFFSVFYGRITNLAIEHARSAARAIDWHLQSRVRRSKKKLWIEELAKSIETKEGIK